MSEIYTGTKFTTVFNEKKMPDYSLVIRELRKWCRDLARISSTSQKDNSYLGNGSIRTESGFLITATNANLADIRKNDVVEVESVDMDKKRIYVNGSKEPSSESFIHNAIYQQRRSAQAIFHGHSDLMLAHYRALKLSVTRNEQPYGTLALMNEVLEALGDKNILIIKNHGFIVLGMTMNEAGQLFKEQYYKAKNLNKS
jgi:ribulose-5-phosphate 4-epimerase/fuculose-1-phosphate aldolase